MADIKLVVKIPEDEYIIFKNSNMPLTWAEHLIKNGTPLPKGHGRLIDADALIKTYDGFVGYDEEIQSINDAPTIIEADKE